VTPPAAAEAYATLVESHQPVGRAICATHALAIRSVHALFRAAIGSVPRPVVGR